MFWTSMKSFAVGVVVLAALLTTGSAVSFAKKPWIADVNTTANNSCCYGDTDGLAPDIWGISPSGEEHHSIENLKDEAGVNCSLLDDTNCRICFIFASVEKNGFILNCALTKDHSYMDVDVGRTDNVTLTLNVVSTPTDAQVSPTSHSNTYKDWLQRVVTPSVLIPGAVLFGVFILVAVITYKVYKHRIRQRQGTQQQLPDESQVVPENERCFWKLSTCCDPEAEMDSPQNKEGETNFMLPKQKLQDSRGVKNFTSKNGSAIPRQRQPHRHEVN